VFHALTLHAAAFGMPQVIVHGGARGVDTLAGLWCLASGIPQQIWRADWKSHGHAAGPIRTRAMLHAARPELMLAFPGGAGTRFAIKTAAALGCRVDAVHP
jgi:hypothetical protein